MENEKKLEIINVMITMLSYALHGEKVDPGFLNDTNDDSVYRLCQFHKVSALASISLDNPDEKWKNTRNESIRRTILFDKEREQILKSFEENQIWYCPLKGIILKDFYPEYGLREMADNDILFDESKAILVKDIMISHGYKADGYGIANHDAYEKKPIYNFEMHRSLFLQSFSAVFFDYYKNIKERLKKDDDNESRYHLSDEDFYIYLIAHAHKHLSSAGSGIRTLIDIFLYSSQKKEMDWDYIDGELKKLGIYDEEKLLVSLAKKVFSANGSQTELNEKEKGTLEYIIDSGVYGTFNNRMNHDFEEYREKGGYYRIKYIFRRIFPEEQKLKEWFPFFYRNVWARPFLIPYRIGRGLLVKRKKIASEIKILLKERKEDASV